MTPSWRDAAGEDDGPDVALSRRYRILRRLLAANSEMLELLADLEDDLWFLGADDPRLDAPVHRLLDGSLLLAENLNLLTGNRYRSLYGIHAEISRAVRAHLARSRAVTARPLLALLSETSRGRLAEVGGKAANLGDLAAAMPAVVPPGFVLTTAAYRAFLDGTGLLHRVRKLMSNMSLIMERQLFRQRAAAIREMIESAELPASLADAIGEGVQALGVEAPGGWAVRSSAIGEDGRMSFAGQFESVLRVPGSELARAYARVVASRWADRAIAYRLIGSFSEAETPMAVLFLPMIEARAAGVLYTRDPGDPAADHMLVNAVPGLADDLVRGRSRGEALVIGRTAPHAVGSAGGGPAGGEPGATSAALDATAAGELADAALAVESHFGTPQDIEWVLAADGRIMVVQARPLALGAAPRSDAAPPPETAPLAQGGITVFPGRAAGPAHVAQSTDDLASVADGSVLLVRQATPEVAAVLPSLAAIVAEHGNVAGHAATLIREARVPAVFGLRVPEGTVSAGAMVSLDAGGRRLYPGAAWPEARRRSGRAVTVSRESGPRGVLNDRILALNLTDPLASSFQAPRCRSIHDVVRFTHEKAVAAIFELGDEVAGRGVRRVWRLETPVPLNLLVLDLGGAVPPIERRKAVAPEEIACAPFKALWRGISSPGVSWAGRVNVSVAGFGSVLASSLNDAWAGLRGLGERNYVLLAPDYLNLNARLGYHFAMVDGLVTEAAENNFVNFRFRGGAAGVERRDLRARFLAEVLRRSGFGVDRRGDLVTAWLRRFPRQASEDGLALIGALMGCARQLDMLVGDETAVTHFVDRFLAGDYAAFS